MQAFNQSIGHISIATLIIKLFFVHDLKETSLVDLSAQHNLPSNHHSHKNMDV